MANYSVTFNNDTPQAWTMGVYQTLPSSPGLNSVSWLQTTSPTQGTSTVQWEITYNVAIAQYTQEGGIGVYPPDSAQILPADLGTKWSIEWDGNVQSLVAVGAAPQADQIIIANNSGHLANPGIGMYGSPSLYQHQVYGDSSAEFTVEPVYWVALFDSLILGEVISSNVTVGPLQLTFVAPQNTATVTASIQGENLVMHLGYGTSTSVDMNQLSERVGGRNTYQKQLHGRPAVRQPAAR
jgi:hypothetical protein